MSGGVDGVDPGGETFWRVSAEAPKGGPALFLDRDGVLVREVGYLHEPRRVELLAGAADLVAEARRRGFAVGVVTNQSGIGRGLYDWRAFAAVQDELERRLGGAGGPFRFDFVAACGARPPSPGPAAGEAHPWRKPAPGMLLQALDTLDLDMAASVLAGDHVGDVQAALTAGVGRCLHVLTGHGLDNRDAVGMLAARQPAGRVLLADDLPDATAQLGWTDPAARRPD